MVSAHNGVAAAATGDTGVAIAREDARIKRSLELLLLFADI
jgi:hypothetical protein